MTNDELTLAAPALGNRFAVDREKRVIEGFQVMRSGHVPHRDVWIDDETLDQLVALGNAAESGVKMNLGHADKTGRDQLGSLLGRARNFRRDANEPDVVRADAHIAEASDVLAPNGAYVLSWAENDPDAFGASVVVRGRYEEKERGERHLRITDLQSVDFVEEPAATTALFSRRAPEDEQAIEAGVTRVASWLFARLFRNEPETRVTPAPTLEEHEEMKLDELTLSQLREARNDIVEELQKEARADADKAARDEVAAAWRGKVEALKQNAPRDFVDAAAALDILLNCETETEMYKALLSIKQTGAQEQLSRQDTLMEKVPVAGAPAPEDPAPQVQTFMGQVHKIHAEMSTTNPDMTWGQAVHRASAQFPELHRNYMAGRDPEQIQMSNTNGA